MCGIVGYIGNNKGKNVAIDGLYALEYRGYDSAGIAYLDDNNKINILKAEGKVKNLENIIDENLKTNKAIAHTRWATHGGVSTINSHPHQQGKITIVHNGIIENYNILKEFLEEKNYKFISQTDTEIAAAYIDYLYQKNNYDIITTLHQANKELLGSYAIGIMIDDKVDELYAIRRNAPLIIGVGNNENFIASDISAILKYTNKYILLENNAIAIIKKDNIIILDENNQKINYEIKTTTQKYESLTKNGYDHYMLKEIHEEIDVLKRTINYYYQNNEFKFPINFNDYNEIHIIGCGSAMYVGNIIKNLIEEELNKKTTIYIASEFRYSKPFINKNDLVIFISQSGETADTLAALELVNNLKIDTLGIVNVENSSIYRNSKYKVLTQAGIEIAVATTKGFISQLLTLMLMIFDAKNKLNNMSTNEINNIFNEINNIDNQIINIINSEKIKEIANDIKNEKDIYFLGRGIDYSLCLEGCLKLKEISYIHSETYASGELKHGSIALIEDNTKVISIITDENLLEKSISNIEEVIARGANVYLLTTNNLKNNINNEIFNNILYANANNKYLNLILIIINLQVLSYYVALYLDREIDQPKNLAKSVTVE